MVVSKTAVHLILLVLALATIGAPAAHGFEEDVIRSWPPPPMKARVSLNKIVEKPSDFWGGGSSLRGFLGKALGTSSEEGQWRPYGLCVDPLGRVLVTDNAGGKVFLIDRENKKTKEINEAGDLELGEPVSVAAGPEGDFYVADPALGLLLHYDKKGEFIASVGPPELKKPTGLAVDVPGGRLVVTDTAGHTVWILGLEGETVSSFGARGTGQGEFNYPTHVCVSAEGDIFVTDALNHRIQIFTREGAYKGEFGEAGDGLGAFNRPKGLAVSSDGHIFVVDAMSSVVQVFDTSGTLLLAVGGPGSDDGGFSLPSGIFIDESDNVYVADTFNGRLQVFRLAGQED